MNEGTMNAGTSNSANMFEMQNGSGNTLGTSQGPIPQKPASAMKRAATTDADKRKKDKKPCVRFTPNKAITLPGIIDYNSDDDRIIALKRQGLDNQTVARKLQEEKRSTVSNFFVTNRWIRLRKALAQAEEDALDDELYDWREDEDEMLHDAHSLVHEKLLKEIENIKNKMWQEVSLNLEKRINKRKYTAKACEERFDGLCDGTALAPIELDSDQEGREILRENRIAKAKRARDDLYYDMHCEENQRIAELAERNDKRGEKRRTHLATIRKRKEVKADMERVRLDRKQELEKIKQDQKEERQRVKDAYHWPSILFNAEHEALDALLKRPFGTTAKELKQERGRNIIMLGDDDLEPEVTMIGDDDEEAAVRRHFVYQALSNEIFGDDIFFAGLDLTPVAKKVPLPTFGFKAAPGSIPVTRESLLNPRSVMHAADLAVLLIERGLPRRGPNETQPQMVARLAYEDETLTQSGLLRLLAKYFDKGKYAKEDLIYKLCSYDVGNCDTTIGDSSEDIEFMKKYEGYKGEFGYLIDIYTGAVAGMEPFFDCDGDVRMLGEATEISDDDDVAGNKKGCRALRGTRSLPALTYTPDPNDNAEMKWNGSEDEYEDAVEALATA